VINLQNNTYRVNTKVFGYWEKYLLQHWITYYTSLSCSF